ncbi:hypothetical protein GCM10022204_16310 [Microlunatus aurantiacus]|uniref:HTH arsR-type domain-containing protein n=1 Tax=Microlunatus aurantiacus TaxID=446786 RepID=A0ABP7D3A9_9ACTN
MTAKHHLNAMNSRARSSQRALDAWALLGDASRRAIIERQSQSPCSVAELADDMPISRPAVSQHPTLLREAGMVRDDPTGGRSTTTSWHAQSLCPRGLPSGFKGGIALTDATIHHQDIRRALGLPRTIPAHRLVPVLTSSLRAPRCPPKAA